MLIELLRFLMVGLFMMGRQGVRSYWRIVRLVNLLVVVMILRDRSLCSDLGSRNDGSQIVRVVKILPTVNGLLTYRLLK